MLLNLTYNDKLIYKKVDETVGKPFTIKERLALSGVTSPKFAIAESSIEIHNLLILDRHPDSCQIEMRPEGIIVRFRSLLETYGLIIPYYKLSVFKGQKNIYSIYRDQYFIKIKSTERNEIDFIKKLTQYKAEKYTSGPNGF
ncbi:hypothetical protein ACG2LH_00405 [Zhouia sp. PK063]|uniref:hypothetical protein n=1 Tax=Zhouia sp. PK063 TaxID=3373602 RepID=UPI0037AB874B